MGYSYDQEENRGYRKLSSNDFKIESSSDGGDNWNTISGLKFERVNSKKIKFSDFSNFNGSDIIKVTPKSNKVFEFIVRNHQENNSLPQSCDENTQVNNIVNVNYVSLSTISNYNLFYINNSNAIFKEKRINIIKNENKIVSTLKDINNICLIYYEQNNSVLNLYDNETKLDPIPPSNTYLESNHNYLTEYLGNNSSHVYDSDNNIHIVYTDLIDNNLIYNKKRQIIIVGICHI